MQAAQGPGTTTRVNDYDSLRDYLKKQKLAEFVLSFEDLAQPAGKDAAARGLPGRRLHRDAAGRWQEREVQAGQGSEGRHPRRRLIHERCIARPESGKRSSTQVSFINEAQAEAVRFLREPVALQCRVEDAGPRVENRCVRPG